MGRSLGRRARFLLATSLAIAVCGNIGAEDRRVEAIDAYLLIDRSASMAASGEAAANWVCTSVVDGLLQSGDRVTIWAFSEKPERIADTTVSDADSKETLKRAIRSIGKAGGEADFSEALRTVAAVEAARPDRRPIAYVLLASALVRGAGDSGDEAAALLRFSRIEDHPGWKAVTLGLGLEHRTKAAAAVFIENVGTGARISTNSSENWN